MDLSQCLMASLSGDANLRTAAEQKLVQLMESDFKQYMMLLAAELRDESKLAGSRQLAGINIKNAVVPRSATEATDEQRNTMAMRWVSLPEDVKFTIKTSLFEALGSASRDVQSAASNTIAHLAAIEIPRGGWADVVPAVLQHITPSPAADEKLSRLRVAAFELLGYICEAVPDHLEVHAPSILNAISYGLAATETNMDIRLAATRALCNSMTFIRQFFEHEQHRGTIMSMVFASCASTNDQVQIAGFECLIEIASAFYHHLKLFMGQIFELTGGAIVAHKDSVDSLAIEFWTTVADVEADLLDERAALLAEDDSAESAASLPVIHNLTEVAALQLVPMLLECLKHQNEEPDDDTNNVSIPAALCLSSFSMVCQKQVIPLVRSFVHAHLASTDWRSQEAAIMSVSAILRCPDADELRDIMLQIVPFLLTLCDAAINDATKVHPHVHDTALWSIGRIAELIPDILDPFMSMVVNVLGRSLALSPRLAEHAAWALMNMGEALSSSVGNDHEAANTLTPFLENLLLALFRCAERPDANQNNLLVAAYEAMSALIASAAPPSFPLIANLAQALIARLKQLQPSALTDASQREAFAAVQAHLCGCLQAVVELLPEEMIYALAQQLGDVLTHVLSTRSSAVSEEALMVVGALALRLKSTFNALMPLLQERVVHALQSSAEPAVCSVAIGTVGDIMRALEGNVVVEFPPFCNEVVTTLLNLALSNSVDKSLKPLVLSALGDVALAMGLAFSSYLPHVLRLFNQATSVAVNDVASLDEDYLDALRLALIEGYTGLLQGVALPAVNQPGGVNPFSQTAEGLPDPPVRHVASLIVAVAELQSSSSELVRSTLSLYCDLVDCMPSVMSSLVSVPVVMSLWRRWPKDEDESARAYVQQMLRQNSYRV